MVPNDLRGWYHGFLSVFDIPDHIGTIFYFEYWSVFLDWYKYGTYMEHE